METPETRKVRHLENVHIPLWLFKDTCWMLKYELAGTLLIIPTITVAFIIVWRTRRDPDVFLPNLSVGFWISANSFWMLGEFFDFDYQQGSLILFVGGILTMVGFGYLLLKGKARLP